MAEAKLEAFRAYNFEDDPAWRAVRNNLEIPPGKEALEVKFRAKFYKREVDPDFDVSLVTSQLPPQQPPAAASAAAAAPAASAARQAAAGAARGAADAARAAADAAAGAFRGGASAAAAARAGKTGELVLLVAHVVLLLSAVVGVQPLNRYLGWQAYFLFCRTAVVTCGYKIYLRFGLPALRPFPAAVAPWMQQVAASTEFYHFLLCTFMMQSPQLWMGMIPIAAAAAPLTLDALGAHFGGHPLWARYGRNAQAILDQSKPAIQRLTTNIEIALGFSTIFAVFSSGLRGAMLVYVYWNTLRMRYWSPESRPYHLQAWAGMHARVEPLLRMAPSLQRYLDYPIRWFQQLGQQQPHRQ